MGFIIRTFTLMGISWLIFSIPANFLTLDYFKINKVDIVGNPKILLLELTEMGNTIYNSSIWDLDFSKLEEELKKDVRVKNIKFENSRLGELKIIVEEKELAYYAQVKNSICLVDKDGIIYGTFKENTRKDIPLIVVEKNDEILELKKLLDMLDGYLLKDLVSQIYKVDENCVEMILIDGTVIKTNEKVKRERYKVLETLYSELIKTKKVEYIDLRFKDFIVKSVGEKSGGK